MTAVVAAVDLGATSGRVVVGRADAHELGLTTVHRFPNTPVETPDGLHWNILELYRNVLHGLTLALRSEPALASIGVDSWGVDYALMRGDRMLGVPYHYRDRRCEDGVRTVHAVVSPERLYARNGLQFLPFNTVYQLATEGAFAQDADAMLLIPDLLTYWLSGEQVTEATNASTTGLLDVHKGTWDTDLMSELGFPDRLLTSLVRPGTRVGGLRDAVAENLGATSSVDVCAVGSHDTASAVVAVPMTGDGAAYISCGTWGLVGVELDQPVLSDAAREANFTNEGGVDGRVRFLHNVMGLWLLNESMRQWEREGDSDDVSTLVRQAAEVTTAVAHFDADDPRFLPPGDMPARIRSFLGERGEQPPRSRAELVRSIIESLADAFARSVQAAEELSGQAVRVVHMVGGGSQNVLLCQLTADRTGRPVLAGPVEATALGNVLVQARALGAVDGDLESLRALVAATSPPRRYEPTAR